VAAADDKPRGEPLAGRDQVEQLDLGVREGGIEVLVAATVPALSMGSGVTPTNTTSSA
jgi:hypothetical protein